MTLQTLLLTRFNIKFLKGYTYNLDYQWLKSRFELFEKFCLPSVEAQTSKDFKWVLFFDKDTPVEFKERTENYKKRLENIEILYVSEADIKTQEIKMAGDLDTYVYDYSSLIEPFCIDADHTLTIRLDNDDSLENTYIEMMQNSVCDLPGKSTPPYSFVF